MSTSRPAAPPRRSPAAAGVVALVLRLLAPAAAVAAVACTWGAAGRPQPLVGLLVLVLGVTCSLAPDSHVGLVVVLVVGIEWLALVDSPSTPWALGAAASLAVFHTALAAATVAPPAARWSRGMGRRWARRLGGAIAAGAGTWVAVVAAGGRRVGGGAPLLVAALAALALVALWARPGEVGADPPVDDARGAHP